MIEIVVPTKGVEDIAVALQRLKGNQIGKVIANATNRAAITARKAAKQKIQETYALKRGNIYNRVHITRGPMDTTIHVKGPYEPIDSYTVKIKKRKPKGVFATIKKGEGSIIPRAFQSPKGYLARLGKDRLPVRGLFGPAIPQTFGNPAVIAVMEREGMKMYEKRLEHELERLTQGW